MIGNTGGKPENRDLEALFAWLRSAILAVVARQPGASKATVEDAIHVLAPSVHRAFVALELGRLIRLGLVMNRGTTRKSVLYVATTPSAAPPITVAAPTSRIPVAPEAPRVPLPSACAPPVDQADQQSTATGMRNEESSLTVLEDTFFSCPACGELALAVARHNGGMGLFFDGIERDLLPELPLLEHGGRLALCIDCLDVANVLRLLGYLSFDPEALGVTISLCHATHDLPSTSSVWRRLAGAGVSDDEIDQIMEAWEQYLKRFPGVRRALIADEIVAREQPGVVGFFHAASLAHRNGSLEETLKRLIDGGPGNAFRR